MPSIPRKELPAYVRRCYEQAKKANIHTRAAEKERKRFYAGGKLQWRDEEITKRENEGRPYISINRCKPAVDQIEGDIRLNPPGPKCKPVGGGADNDTADILEGLIREVDYRSNAKVAYATAGKYVATSGIAYIELATEYTGEREMSQQLVVLSVEDPDCVFLDPTARMANRQDAAWGGKLKMYTKSEYISAFGDKRRVLQPRGMQAAMGWIQDAIGAGGNLAQVNEWTGSGEGPFFVAEFYMVDVEPSQLTTWTDNISRFDDEPGPKGQKPRVGAEFTRMVPRRKIKKYVVDALEVLKPEPAAPDNANDWTGTLIPLFPVLGPEIYIEGKLYRLSLISDAIDSNRALNYVATTATELAGSVPKSPWIGPKGSFDDPRWQSANSEMWAYLEYTPVLITNEQGGQVPAPPPQRNQWEAPIQWLIGLATFFAESIKSVTGIYDPSLGKQKSDQSGRAIEQLRSESNVGNFSYSDNLHRTIEVIYNEMIVIFPKIMDGERVVTIVRPDTTHEEVRIHQLFDEGKPSQKVKNNISAGRYAVRVVVDRNKDERKEDAVDVLVDFFKVCPQATQIPGVMSQFCRLLANGNPEIEHIAELLSPNDLNGEQTPEQTQMQLAQAMAQNQKQGEVIQKLAQALQAKLPEIEAKKWQSALDALTKIRVAEINASKDADHQNADREAASMEHIIGLAHETAMQGEQQAHEKEQAEKQAQLAQTTQINQQAHEQTMAENEPEPAAK